MLGVYNQLKGLNAHEKQKPGFYHQDSSCQIPLLSSKVEQFLGSREFGYFVEVGGYDGVTASNTLGLAKRNWHGLIVEPIPKFAELCAANHKKHSLVKVVNLGISNRENEKLEFNVSGALTTAVPAQHEELKSVNWASNLLTDEKIKVSCKRLDTVMRENNVPLEFDVLVVDVEGMEADVFASFDLSVWKPKMLIVELTETHPDFKNFVRDPARLLMRIQFAGYQIIYKDHINTVFIRQAIWDSIFKP